MSSQAITNLPIESAEYRWSWTRLISAAVFLLVGLVLLSSAGLKAYQLATEPVVGQGFFDARWLLVGVVQSELVLAVWLLSGLWPAQARIAASTCLGVFSLVAASKWLNGEASCGCFGKMHFKPMYTTLIDLSLIALLIKFRPVVGGVARGRFGKTRIIIAAAALLALTSTSLTAIVRFRPTVLNDAPATWPAGSLVVLEPEQWVGKTFPLFHYIDVGDQLRSGHWKVILYHSDCSACQAAVPKFEAMDRNKSEVLKGARVALIEMPPYAPSGHGLASPDSSCLGGRLSEERDWFAQTPVVLDLDGGNVSAAKSGEER